MGGGECIGSTSDDHESLGDDSKLLLAMPVLG